MRELLQALRASHRTLELPPQVRLPESSGAGQPLRLDACLRLQPGRRAVLRGESEQGPVILKLFVGADAPRRMQRERDGVRALVDADLPTPALLQWGVLEDNGPELLQSGVLDGAGYLLFAALDATPVAKTDAAAVLEAVLGLQARLHAAGLAQTDQHLGNYLHHQGEVFAIDGDGIRHGSPLSVRQRCQNLAILCVQCDPAREQPALADWLQVYNQAYRAASAEAEDIELAHLRAATRSERRKRLARFQRKTERDCTEFLRRQSGRDTLLAVRSDYAQLASALDQFMADPDAAMSAGKSLKQGNTATVARIWLDDVPVIAKRYNIKSGWHRLLQSLRRSSRARRSWRNALGLDFLGIPVAKPIALFERRRGPLRDRAYLLMTDLGDEDLATTVTSAAELARFGAPLKQVFAALAYTGLAHGDTKATNFAVCGDEVWLLDLDSVHAGDNAKDRARFVRNWSDPALQQLAGSLFDPI